MSSWLIRLLKNLMARRSKKLGRKIIFLSTFPSITRSVTFSSLNVLKILPGFPIPIEYAFSTRGSNFVCISAENETATTRIPF